MMRLLRDILEAPLMAFWVAWDVVCEYFEEDTDD